MVVSVEIPFYQLVTIILRRWEIYEAPNFMHERTASVWVRSGTTAEELLPKLRAELPESIRASCAVQLPNCWMLELHAVAPPSTAEEDVDWDDEPEL